MAGQLGYCGLDRGRQPLTGEEIRGCWESRAASVATGTPVPITIGAARPAGDGRPHLDFVEIDAISPAGSATGARSPDVPREDEPVAPPTRPPTEPGWDLWGDLEP